MSEGCDTARIPSHVYVHVPVCRRKCAYCDFYSVEEGDLPLTRTELAEALVRQALAWQDRGLVFEPLETLYLGGGTPTMLGDDLAFLVDVLRRGIGLVAGAEVTIEANPDSLDERLVSLLAEAGVTRVSLGVQSFHDDTLVRLGRVHDAARAVAAARAVRSWGLTLAIDLICGIPGQTMETWLASVQHAIDTGAEHISVYPLSLEAGTPLAAAVMLGAYAAPDEDLTAEMMLAAEDALTEEGFEHYEISNYARPGFASRHNTAYWTGRPYLGVGPGAHGMLDARTAEGAGVVVREDTARVRYAVAADLLEGLGPEPQVSVELLTAWEAEREDIMLGLRLARGVDGARVRRAGLDVFLERYRRLGLLEEVGGRWRLTKRGFLLGNEVFQAVWAEGS